MALFGNVVQHLSFLQTLKFYFSFREQKELILTKNALEIFVVPSFLLCAVCKNL